MPSANKDRVTISLHLDKRLYTLLKRCSAYEKEPMSRIVDKILEPYVEKYESETLEDMNDLDSIMKQERAQQEEKEYIDRLDDCQSGDNRLDAFARQLVGLEANRDRYNMPQKFIDQFEEYIKSETSKAEQKEIEKRKELHTKESKRWIEITKKYPLPEGTKTFTIKKQY